MISVKELIDKFKEYPEDVYVSVMDGKKFTFIELDNIKDIRMSSGKIIGTIIDISENEDN